PCRQAMNGVPPPPPGKVAWPLARLSKSRKHAICRRCTEQLARRNVPLFALRAPRNITLMALPGWPPDADGGGGMGHRAVGRDGASGVAPPRHPGEAGEGARNMSLTAEPRMLRGWKAALRRWPQSAPKEALSHVRDGFLRKFLLQGDRSLPLTEGERYRRAK